MEDVVQLLEYSVILEWGFDRAADSMAQDPIKDSVVSMEVWRKKMLGGRGEAVVTNGRRNNGRKNILESDQHDPHTIPLIKGVKGRRVFELDHLKAGDDRAPKLPLTGKRAQGG
jgi:hypothetical protein